MNKTMKTIAALAVVTALGTCTCFAGGHHGGPRPGGGHRGGFSAPRPAMHVGGGHRPSVRYHSGWGHGGRNFWPGFAGGVVGGLLYDSFVPRTTIVTTPTVVTTPAVVAAPTVVTTPTVVAAPATTVQSVWVPGCYVDQVQANGTVIRVWQPGHYEQRTVYVQ